MAPEAAADAFFDTGPLQQANAAVETILDLPTKHLFRALLTFMPAAGRSSLVSSILRRQEEAQGITEEWWLKQGSNYMASIRTVRAKGGRTPAPQSRLSPPSRDLKHWPSDTALALVISQQGQQSDQELSEGEEQKREQTQLKALLRIREDWICPVTGRFDRGIKKDSPAREKALLLAGRRPTTTIAAHILPFVLAENGDDTDEAREWGKRLFRETIQRFCHQPVVDLIIKLAINAPQNAILMDSSTHDEFGGFELVFDKVEGENAYQVVRPRVPDTGANGWDLEEFPEPELIVTFNTQALDDKRHPISPPDPELLAVHAAFARVFYASGMADVWMDDEEHDSASHLHLAADGNDAEFFMHKFVGRVPAAVWTY